MIGKKENIVTKKELAEKIAKEQNLDATKLMRLTVVELEKMDAVVPDAEIESEIDIFEGAELEEEESDESESQEEDPSDVVEEAKAPVEGRQPILVGHHPITKKPVYK